MLNLRRMSVATAVLMVMTSFTPSQAMPIPVPALKPIVASETATQVQYRPWERREMRREWRRDRARDFRRDRDWRRGDRYGWYNGHRGYRERRSGYRYHNGYWFPLAAFAAGAIISGAASSQARPSYGSNHAQWCANRWRSYRAYDNSYQPYNGPRQQCVSPYR